MPREVPGGRTSRGGAPPTPPLPPTPSTPPAQAAHALRVVFVDGREEARPDGLRAVVLLGQRAAQGGPRGDRGHQQPQRPAPPPPHARPRLPRRSPAPAGHPPHRFPTISNAEPVQRKTTFVVQRFPTQNRETASPRKTDAKPTQNQGTTSSTSRNFRFPTFSNAEPGKTRAGSVGPPARRNSDSQSLRESDKLS